MMKQYLFGGILAMMILVFFISFASITYQNLDVDVDSNTSSKMSYLFSNATYSSSLLENKTGVMQDNAPGGTGMTTTASGQSRGDSIAQGSVNILSIVPTTYTTVSNTINMVANIMHVPNIVVTALVSLILLGITLWMLNLLSINLLRGG